MRKKGDKRESPECLIHIATFSYPAAVRLPPPRSLTKGQRKRKIFSIMSSRRREVLIIFAGFHQSRLWMVPSRLGSSRIKWRRAGVDRKTKRLYYQLLEQTPSIRRNRKEERRKLRLQWANAAVALDSQKHTGWYTDDAREESYLSKLQRKERRYIKIKFPNPRVDYTQRKENGKITHAKGAKDSEMKPQKALYSVSPLSFPLFSRSRNLKSLSLFIRASSFSISTLSNGILCECSGFGQKSGTEKRSSRLVPK